MAKEGRDQEARGCTAILQRLFEKGIATSGELAYDITEGSKISLAAIQKCFGQLMEEELISRESVGLINQYRLTRKGLGDPRIRRTK